MRGDAWWWVMVKSCEWWLFVLNFEAWWCMLMNVEACFMLMIGGAWCHHGDEWCWLVMHGNDWWMENPWWRRVLIALCMRSLAKLLSECSRLLECWGLDSWRTSGMNPANLTRCDLGPKKRNTLFFSHVFFSPDILPRPSYFIAREKMGVVSLIYFLGP